MEAWHLESKNCHVDQSEIANMESKNDFSCLHTQNDKRLNSIFHTL